MDNLYTYKGKCTRVVDGDTIVCDIDLGFFLSLKEITLRLNRVNAPESRTKDKNEKEKGLATKEWIKEKLEGKDIIIQTFKDKQTDAFGRYLSEVFLEDVCINDILVEKGLAVYKKY